MKLTFENIEVIDLISTMPEMKLIRKPLGCLLNSLN
jgi:hypothetical protein